MRNVLAHAAATHVRVLVTRDSGRAVLVVEDDGRGFEPGSAGTVTETGHVGLRALSDLVAEVGGSVEVATGPELGTEVRVEVPVEP